MLQMQHFLLFFMFQWSNYNFFYLKKSIHWSVWPSVILCLIGGYLLTNFYDATVRLGDALSNSWSFFWSTHIIFTGKL